MVIRSLVVQLGPQSTGAACICVLRAAQRGDLFRCDVVRFGVVDLLACNNVDLRIPRLSIC